MPQPSQIKYEHQGETFILKETTVENREAVAEMMKEYQAIVMERAKKIKEAAQREELIALKEAGKYEGEIPEEVEIPTIDEYEFYFRLFIALTIGPHDKLDFRKFNAKLAEAAKDDFLLDAQKIVNELMLFSMS